MPCSKRFCQCKYSEINILCSIWITHCIIWGQNISTINHLYILQKKALRIINFKEHNAHSSPLSHQSKLIKIADKVKIENFLFINKYSNNKLPIFTVVFIFINVSHLSKYCLPLKEIFKSLVSKQCFCLYG